MVKSFTPTRRGNPCQLCGDTSGKCRETSTTLLCMSLTDAIGLVPGYKFIGLTKDGLWGKWIKDDGQNWSEAERERRRLERQWQREQRALAEAERHAKSMSVEDRDRYYRCLFDQLTLHPADRLDLHRRGLSEAEIKAGGFKSVEPWQRLEQELPHTLPGVSLSGWNLNVAAAGYLCPVRDEAGRIVGCQLRLRDAVEGGRYRWLSSSTKKRPHGPSPHLPNGELPLAVHRPAVIQRSAIALVEGTGPKPLILSLRQGQVTIGAAGGLFASSAKTLQVMLETVSGELGTKEIEFYPDAGAITNKQVMRQYRAVWKRLRRWGYSVRVAWWGQVTKAEPDVDELEDLDSIHWLTCAQFEAISHPRSTWLEQIQQRLQQVFSPRKAAAALKRSLAAPDPDVVEYAEGERQVIWQGAAEQGYRFILDQSATGTGKSFDAGRMMPDLFGLRQLIYVSDQHRNPTVSTLTQAEGWVDLEARHAGLSQEETPGGGRRVKRSSAGEVPSIAANCNRTKMISALRAKHVNGADTASLICGTCPLREACTHAEGPGYGFLMQRQAALASMKLRSHPDSLPLPQDYEYDAIGLLWDEPGQSFVTKRDVQVTLTDLEQTMMALLPYPQLLEAVQEVLVALLPYLKGQESVGRYGLSHAEVVKILGSPAVNVLELERVLQPDLSFLNTTLAHGVDLADLPASLRKKFSERDAEMAEQANQKVMKQWLPELLRVLTGELPGTVRLESKGLILSLADTRHREIAQAAGVVIFLDATLSRQDLALKLGCQPDEIFVCRQRVPEAHNLTLRQVIDLGRLGMQRGADQNRRAQAIVEHYQAIDAQTKVIDFKRFAQAGMGAWWRDSRGVNDFTETTTLILVGTPCRNLADLQAEYAILTGIQDSEDEGFKAFVDRAILADIHQAIGRLRAHRRPDEALEVVLLSDFALDIVTQQVKASEITIEAAGREERLLLAAKAAAEQLQNQGQKLTQTAVAAMTGYSQQRLSQIWKLLLSLLGISHSKSSKNSSGPNDVAAAELAVGVAAAVRVMVAESEPLQLLEGVMEVFLQWLSSRQRAMVWQRLSVEEQIQVLAALMLALPSETLMALEGAE